MIHAVLYLSLFRHFREMKLRIFAQFMWVFDSTTRFYPSTNQQLLAHYRETMWA
jgi:hypothetical protein